MAADTKAPKAAKPRCDVPGCGNLADICTDGTEEDKHPSPGPSGKRKAVAGLNICLGRHENWPFSDDARAFAASPDFLARKAG